MNHSTFWQFQELVARYSGALAFLQTQHQSASNLLLKSPNIELQTQYLPKMSSGEIAIGVGFSHLRRPNSSLVTATPIKNGYEFNGTVPWVTGQGIFQTFIAAAICPAADDTKQDAQSKAIYGMVPLVNTQQPNGGQLQIGKPIALAAMQSTNTVTVAFTRWQLLHTEIVCVTPANAIHQNDVLNVLHHSFFALGCASAGLDILETALQKNPLPTIQLAYDILNQELQECRRAIAAADDQLYENRLDLRAQAIALAYRCAQAGAIASAGAANTLDHPAQRIYREALVFSVAGQTHDVMNATLSQLIRIPYTPRNTHAK